ncbi:hypothetical protein [Leptospira perdikensis]|uniref:Uncharacterized protein n=1 Tax=Leptospira perdikensis TaxID=2484948 RepID=A0A4R9JEF1_9LEPT|nr:hypothetical protein [Leptospira perdikensis]TGL37304.1 hypothetical protein EHQ49_13770 [Leptospira perdikensis]
MVWNPFRKKKQKLTISKETIQRLEEESKKLGRPQILVLDLERNLKGMGNVLVGFADKTPTDFGYIRWKQEKAETILSLGELRFESGKFYFFPNIDLEWEKTLRPYIHRITANYLFSEEPIYLEAKDFFRLRPILHLCFQREGVSSLYLKGTICQLEIQNLTEDKEVRISEDLLTYLSSLYESPWEE